jgi:hypothetical protein
VVFLLLLGNGLLDVPHGSFYEFLYWLRMIGNPAEDVS